MFFSIIVVTYNAGDKLCGTIWNILGQTCRDREIIIKDGGSTDGSREQLQHLLESEGEDGYCILTGRDAGIYDAMNQAVSAAQGEYLYFLNCGDELHDPRVLEQVKNSITQNTVRTSAPADAASVQARKGGGWQNETADTAPAIYYGDVIEHSSGQMVRANPRMTHFAMYRYLPCHQACFYHRSLFTERGFDTAYRVRADYEHFLWCCIEKNVPAAPLGFVIADYEGGGYSETPEGRDRSAAEHREITRRYFTGRERFLYRLYLIVTLQPLRFRLAQGRHTAALYDAVKNAIYKRKSF